LGSNKNEKSVVTISKAYPVINDIVSNIDAQISYKELKSSHKSRSEDVDFKCILKHLRKLNPFCQVDGRTLYSYNGMKRSAFVELLPQRPKTKLMTAIKKCRPVWLVTWEILLSIQILQ
jgi:hypothetical protein